MSIKCQLLKIPKFLGLLNMCNYAAVMFKFKYG